MPINPGTPTKPLDALSIPELLSLTADDIDAQTDPTTMLAACERLERLCTASALRRQIDQAVALADTWNLFRDRLNEVGAAGDARPGYCLRGGGTAEINAARTVRRCT